MTARPVEQLGRLLLLGLLAWSGRSSLADDAAPAAALAASAPVPASTPADQPPVTAYAGLNTVRSLSLSPDGEHLAGIVNKPDGALLFVSDFDGGHLKGIVTTDNRQFQLQWVQWASNTRLVLGTGLTSKYAGISIRETRSFALNGDGGSMVALAPSDDFIQDAVVDWLPQDDHHVLMNLGGAIAKVDLDSGKPVEMIQKARRGTSWLLDAQHRVRLAVRSDGEDTRISVRDEPQGEWRELWRFEAGDTHLLVPIAFGEDPSLLYFTAEENDRLALFSARLDDVDEHGVPRRQVIAASDSDDFAGVRFAPASHELIGFAAPGEGDAARAFLPEPLKELARGVDAVLPRRYNSFTAFSRNMQRYVLVSGGNGTPPEAYVGDRRTGQLRLVMPLYPELAGRPMVGKSAVEFKARDGMAIRGYLAVPRGEPPAQGWPLVLMPHGGPFWSDSQDFDPWTELLASRGYAVLQVNFRGSTSEGISFIRAGFKKWGLEMQDDLTDGVRWAIEQRHVDPKRICIAGASFGGYAALMGVVKTPDLYRCAVSFAGVSDLVTLSRHEADIFASTKALDKTMGNYWYDRGQLKKTSPALHAEDIRVPVLLIHGTADAQVPYEQSKLMADALKSAGKRYEFITQEGGDHQLTLGEHRVQFLERLLQFIDANLGPGVSPTLH